MMTKEKKTGKREAKPHTTREAKDVVTPGSLSVCTRKTHPHLFHSTKKHGPRPKVWPRLPRYTPCKTCSRVLTDTHSQAVVCYGTTCDTAYLRCRVCYSRWTLPREKAR